MFDGLGPIHLLCLAHVDLGYMDCFHAESEDLGQVLHEGAVVLSESSDLCEKETRSLIPAAIAQTLKNVPLVRAQVHSPNSVFLFFLSIATFITMVFAFRALCRLYTFTIVSLLRVAKRAPKSTQHM
jgi:hypothetical protein